MFNLTKLSLLWEWVGELKKNVATLITEVGPTGENLLPSRSASTTGQILKLTGENKTPSWADEYSYTPPAYSETEVNTGRKWIDGKDVYELSLSGTTPNSSSPFTLNCSYETLINVYGYLLKGDISVGATSNLSIYGNSDKTGLVCTPSTTDLREKPYNIVIVYTKPAMMTRRKK